jgi:amino acid transporter
MSSSTFERTVDDGAGYQRTLTTSRLTLLVVAAAAPLGAVIGNVPLGILLGNGAGLPVAFLVAGVLIACFAVGYIAISRVVPAASGFASYVEAGLGRGAGLGAAYATTLSYAAGTIAIAAGSGYFANLIAGSYGLDLPWWAWSALAVAVVGLLGRRAADLSAKALFVFIAAEFLILVALDVAIVVHHGFSAFPVASFSTEQVFSGGAGPALMVGLTSFIGVESAVIYAREARDPVRSLPRATYAAVGAIAVFYFITCWLIVGAAGAEQVVPTTAELQGDLVFALASDNGGTVLLTLMQVFFCTSLLAVLVALHNATTRYMQSLGDRGALPHGLARVHARHRGPSVASDTLIIVTVVLLAVFALTGADPYIGLNTSMIGLFTIGIVAMQALVAFAALVYFRRRGDRRIWTTAIAPTLAALGLLAAVIAIVANYPVLSGSSAVVPNLLPVLVPLALAAGFVVHAVRGRDAAPLAGGSRATDRLHEPNPQISN